MSGISRQLGGMAFALLVACALTLPASGQGIVVGGGLPGVVVNPVTGTVMPGMPSYYPGAPGYPGYNPTLPNPYSPPWDYYPPYGYDPYAGYLRGTADVYRAQGTYQINYAQSQILMQKYYQEKVETRRKIYDQWLYERNNTPSLQDLRERDQRADLRRALTDPPLADITDGRALNILLKKAIAVSTGNAPNVPISAEVVKNINVAVDVGLGLGAVKGLREGAPLDWPPTLLSADYDADRNSLEKLLRDAVDDASRNGTININTLQKIQTAYGNMVKRLDDDIFHLTADQYLAGRRYLKQLDNSIRALQKKNVEKYFSRLEKVRTVAELVREMSGESFAPAGVGDEKAYVALHQALVAYVMQLQPVLPEK